MRRSSEGGDAPVICVDGPGRFRQRRVGRGLGGKAGLALFGQRRSVSSCRGPRLGCGGWPWDDEAALARLAQGMDAETEGGRLLLNGADRTADIRREQVAKAASAVARHPAVRQAVLRQQRNARRAPGLVADGRDMGTAVFPDAELKIFLDASAEERARRRHKQLRSNGMRVSFHKVLADIRERDGRGQQARCFAPAASGGRCRHRQHRDDHCRGA